MVGSLLHHLLLLVLDHAVVDSAGLVKVLLLLLLLLGCATAVTPLHIVIVNIVLVVHEHVTRSVIHGLLLLGSASAD